MKKYFTDVRRHMQHLRAALEPAFSPETAFSGSPKTPDSSGHCAAVAAIVHRRCGGWLASAIIEKESHWFNRLRSAKGVVDVDLTCDQLGRPTVQVRAAGRLYAGTRIRRPSELNAETLARSELLERRA